MVPSIDRDFVLVDLSHRIEPGMVTYKGLPAPLVCDYLSREQSRGFYPPGTEFAIQTIEMVGNTGTYLDSPFHRYADGADLAGLALEDLAMLDTIVVRPGPECGLAIDREAIDGIDVAGRAVLFHTGWDRHWRSDAYFTDHPFLTERAAQALADRGASLVGIDSHNIDDTRGNARPAHSILLGHGIAICEHMTGLDQLPLRGALFNAVPPKFAGVGTFPVRAFALVPSVSS